MTEFKFKILELKGRRGLTEWKVCEQKKPLPNPKTKGAEKKETTNMNEENHGEQQQESIKSKIAAINSEEYEDEDPYEHLYIYNSYEEYLKRENIDPKSLVRGRLSIERSGETLLFPNKK